MLDIFLSDVVADDRDHIIDNIECWHIGNDIDIMLLVRTWILVFLLMIMCGFFFSFMKFTQQHPHLGFGP